MVTVVALAVALLVGALVFPAQPHEFLLGTRQVWITVTSSPPYKDLCETQYESDLSVREVADKAGKELDPLGWERTGNAFYTPGENAERIMIYEGKVRSRGKTVIRIERIATPVDRFNAWLDRLLKR